MTDPDPEDPAERWARMWERLRDRAPIWREDEIGEVWRHQLTAPVEGWAAGVPPRPVTCGQLLHGEWPESEGLRLLKDFAKANRDHPASELPREIAAVLYLAAIAAARVRLRSSLSTLTSSALLAGWEWAERRPWLDEATRILFRGALSDLAQRKSSSD